MVGDRSVMDRMVANREVHDLLRDGYRAEWTDERGEQQIATVRYVDFADSTKSDWLAASQVWFAGDLHRRRTDVVLFVNGIPLVLAEFKEPNRPTKAAFDDNITDYRDTIPRSEEHTSELQSLMRISYAVFCLQKTNKSHNITATF